MHPDLKDVDLFKERLKSEISSYKILEDNYMARACLTQSMANEMCYPTCVFSVAYENRPLCRIVSDILKRLQ